MVQKLLKFFLWCPLGVGSIGSRFNRDLHSLSSNLTCIFTWPNCIYTENFSSRWRNMYPSSLRLFIQKLQPKAGLGGYDILFVHFVVEAKSKSCQLFWKIPKNLRLQQISISCFDKRKAKSNHGKLFSFWKLKIGKSRKKNI